MNNEQEEHIKIKLAITLYKLLSLNKKQKNMDSIAKSYNQIALSADIRKATVSNIFNARSIPNFRTLILIIEAMEYTLGDFAKVYESIEFSEISQFKNKGQ